MRTRVALVTSAALVATACGSGSESTSSSRTRNTVPVYETPVVRQPTSIPWDRGFYSTGNTYEYQVVDSQDRARAAAGRSASLAPPEVPPRPHRPTSAPPPIYERVGPGSSSSAPSGGSSSGSSSRVSTARTAAGAPMKTGGLGKLMGGLGNMGMMMGASLAVAGVGMALEALGAPPFLTSLFGGGGDAATAAALAAIQQTLNEINAKVDRILEQLDEMQTSLDQLTATVNRVGYETCSQGVSQTFNSLSDTVSPISSLYERVYRNQFASSHSSTDAYSDEERAFFDGLHAEIAALRPRESIERIEGLVLGNASIASATGTSLGLLSHVQKCTLWRKRFLTNDDTAQWQALVTLFINYQSQAAMLDLWDEMYLAQIGGRPPNLTRLNTTNLTLRRSAAVMGFNTSMQIPEGQFLDTVTNKMWRAAPSGTQKVSLIDALGACVPEEDLLVNYAPRVSWDGFATRNLSRCVATQERAATSGSKVLDNTPWASSERNIDGEKWRIPAIGEIETGGGLAASVPRGDVGLLNAGVNAAGTQFQNWNRGQCGSAGCATPAEYLRSFGAQVTLDPGIVWTNTTNGSLGRAGRDDWGTLDKDDVSTYFNYVWRPNATSSQGSNLYAFCEDDENIYVTDNKTFFGTPIPRQLWCEDKDGPSIRGGELYQVHIPVPSELSRWAGYVRDNSCFRIALQDNPNHENFVNGRYYFGAEVLTINLGPQSTNAGRAEYTGRPGPVDLTSYNGVWGRLTYALASPGQARAYFANRAGVTEAIIACDHDHYHRTVVKLPQTAQAMWVRNLPEDEVYYSVPSTTGPSTRTVQSFQSAVEPPSIATLALGDRNVVHTLNPSAQTTDRVIVRCLVNPETDPESPGDVITRGRECPGISRFSLDLPEGHNRVYMVAYRVNSSGVQGPRTNLEIADIYVAPPPPPPTTTTTTTTQPPSTTPPEQPATPSPVTTPAEPIPSTTAPPTASTVSLTEDDLVIARVATTQPATRVVEGVTVAVPVSNAASRTIDFGTLIAQSRLKARKGETFKVTVNKGSGKVCRWTGVALVGTGTGRCKVTVALAKKGKKGKVRTSRRLTVTVM